MVTGQEQNTTLVGNVGVKESLSYFAWKMRQVLKVGNKLKFLLVSFASDGADDLMLPNALNKLKFCIFYIIDTTYFVLL